MNLVAAMLLMLLLLLSMLSLTTRVSTLATKHLDGSDATDHADAAAFGTGTGQRSRGEETRPGAGKMGRDEWLRVYGSATDKAARAADAPAVRAKNSTAESKAKARRRSRRVHKTNATHARIVGSKTYKSGGAHRNSTVVRRNRTRAGVGGDDDVRAKRSSRRAVKMCDRMGGKSNSSSSRCLNRTEVEVIRQAPAALHGLVAAARRLQRHAPSHFRKHVIITASNLKYRGAVFNWIHHMNLLNIKNFLVLCFDTDLAGIVGDEHGVLMQSRISFDYNKKVTRPPRARRARNSTSSRSARQTHRRRLRRGGRGEGEGGLEEAEAHPRSEEVDFKSGDYSAPAKKARRHADRPRPAFSPAVALRSSRDSHFFAMMVAKYEAIRELTAQGFSVIWSDTDALWLRPCAYQQLLGLMSRSPQGTLADMAGQRGRQPVAISDLVGSCLCTGLFLTNPTSASSEVLAEVIDDIVEMTYVTTFEKRDDQALLNDIIYQRGGLYFQGGPQLRSFALPDKGGAKRKPYGGRPMYGVNSSRGVDYTFVNKTMTDGFVNSKGKRLRQRGQQTFSLALLPYASFPRGVVSVPGSYYMNATDVAGKARANRKKPKLSQLRAGGEDRSADDAPSSRNASEGLSRQERGFLKNVQTLSARQRSEWQLVRGDACVWHLISTKEGDDKVRSMLLDGVYRVPALLNVNASAKFADLSPDDVRLMQDFLGQSFRANNGSGSKGLDGSGAEGGGDSLLSRLSDLLRIF